MRRGSSSPKKAKKGQAEKAANATTTQSSEATSATFLAPPTLKEDPTFPETLLSLLGL